MRPGPDFSVTRQRAGDAWVVAPVGEIDLATIDALQAEIDAALAAPLGELVLDLRRVAFLDSTAVRLVVRLAHELAAAFAVVRGKGEVARVFELVGLEDRVRLLDAPPGG